VIPRVIPPLTGLYALVTRPQPQADTFAAAINASGGHATVFPTLAIERVEQPAVDSAELVIFVSANAVEHGLALLRRAPGTRLAAIGKATAAALTAGGAPADIVPAEGFTSEALLAHPELNLVAGLRVQIVRGVGGRETLHQELQAREVVIETLEVYRRVRPTPDPAQLTALEEQWREIGFDIVTATSVETLQNLQLMLTETGRLLLRSTPLLVVSHRIAAAAAELGLNGECVLAQADEHSMLGALGLWRMRARMVR
jgi:uroporphyrinogen-III synthase